MFDYLNYNDYKLLRHRKTLAEEVNARGYNAIFAGTDVDAETQTALVSYFSQDRLNAPFTKWQWLFSRNLNTYYPIYKDQLDAWTERKTYTWFYDNVKRETLESTKNTDLDETTSNQIAKTLAEIVQNTINETAVTDRDNTKHSTYAGKVEDSGSQNRTGSYSNEDENNTNETTTGTHQDTSAENGKAREFGFNYPESNYQGGVIPYDLTNNPSVEFINNQGDRITKLDKTSSGTTGGTKGVTSDGSASGNSTENASDQRITNNSITQDGTDNTDETKTTNRTDNRNASTNDNTTENGTKATDIQETINEIKTHQGDNLNKLADDLINQIPTTNFFKQFTAVLYKNFQQCYLVDEIIEEMDEEED